MYIYIKTPFYKSSKFIPHLVEHLANLGKNNDIENYFNNVKNTDIKTFSTYTFFELPNYLNIDQFLKKIFEPLTIENIINETIVIKKELKKVNYEMKLFDKIGKKFYSKEFDNNSFLKFSNKEIIEYHKKYYNENNVIVCDDNYNIIYDKYIFKNEKKDFIINKYKLKINVNGYDNFISVSYNNSFENYYYYFFLEELINSYFEYKYRFVKKQYFFENESYFFRTEELNFFCISGKYDIGFNEDFFIKFKNYFKNLIINGYGRKGKIINKLLLGIEINENKIINFIDNINYKNVKKFLGKKIDY